MQVFGRSLELHPVIVLLSLAFWFTLWGVVGAILSIPVTAVLRIVLSHINHPYARVIIGLLEGVKRGALIYIVGCFVGTRSSRSGVRSAFVPFLHVQPVSLNPHPMP